MIRLIDENGERLVTQSEYDLIMASKYVWSKEAHIAEINQLHDELFKSILSANNYIEMAELGLWAQQPDSLFRNEAIAIKAWYINTCEIICNYETTVNEQNAVEPIEFIDNLPTYGE
jgi:hypothetical protein